MRWEICFNLSMLRMLSFAMDLHWRRRQLVGGSTSSGNASHQQGACCREQAEQRNSTVAQARWRQKTFLPSSSDYGMTMYLAYVLYAPLYLAGPIITFNDYAWQLKQWQAPLPRMVSMFCKHDAVTFEPAKYTPMHLFIA